jgi:hypothetical protein
MNDKVMTPRLPSPTEAAPSSRQSAARAQEQKAAARKKTFALILLDALRGSRPYVESYRAGRGAE